LPIAGDVGVVVGAIPAPDIPSTGNLGTDGVPPVGTIGVADDNADATSDACAAATAGLNSAAATVPVFNGRYFPNPTAVAVEGCAGNVATASREPTTTNTIERNLKDS
jgi:hypothetical protein